MNWCTVWKVISHPAFGSIFNSGSILLICWVIYRTNNRISMLQEQLNYLHQCYFKKWVKTMDGEDVDI